MDQYSDLTFIFFQEILTSDETVLTKKTFERYPSLKQVCILHYHANNGCFAYNRFTKDSQAENQCFTCWSVNAHWQKWCGREEGKAPPRANRTCLLYAMRKWPRMIIANLWPYALHYMNDVANDTPKKGEKLPPLEKSSSVSVAPKIRYFHSFGCLGNFGIMSSLKQSRKIQ